MSLSTGKEYDLWYSNSGSQVDPTGSATSFAYSGPPGGSNTSCAHV